MGNMDARSAWTILLHYLKEVHDETECDVGKRRAPEQSPLCTAKSPSFARGALGGIGGTEFRSGTVISAVPAADPERRSASWKPADPDCSSGG